MGPNGVGKFSLTFVGLYKRFVHRETEDWSRCKLRSRRRPSPFGKSSSNFEKAERGMAMPYDAERVGRLRKMLVEARKRKLSDGLARRRQER